MMQMVPWSLPQETYSASAQSANAYSSHAMETILNTLPLVFLHQNIGESRLTIKLDLLC